MSIQEPYPGLRPFRTEEFPIFFGRTAHTAELLNVLGSQHFAAVIGDSGIGKSSFVKAGVIPALYSGTLKNTTSRWRISSMRPGSVPLENLARALEISRLKNTFSNTLKESTLGLTRELESAQLAEGESILLVVDQFEELFRFERNTKVSDKAQFFIASLLEVLKTGLPQLYLLLTMRSDFLGNCAKFQGLPQAISRGQYLMPQLSRSQVRECIERPPLVFGATVEASLVDLLLNELSSDTSDLLILQHALNRTFLQFKAAGGSTITKEHYRQAGTLKESLDRHIASIPLSGSAEPWKEKLFCCLIAEDGSQKIRNPLNDRRIFAMLNIADDPGRQSLVREVMAKFSEPANPFLIHYSDSDAGEVWDIPHERIISQWTQLKDWSESESRRIALYERAADDSLQPQIIWRDPRLSEALDDLSKGTWNAAWAKERLPDHRATFEQVQELLYRSEEAIKKEKEEKKRLDEADRKARIDAERIADAERKHAAAAQRLADKERRYNFYLLIGIMLLLGLIYFLYRQNHALEEGRWGAQLNTKDGLRYVPIHPGLFEMGCSDGDSNCVKREEPRHPVEIRTFWMGQTEVTQRAWKKVFHGKPLPVSQPDQSDFPVLVSSWDEAQAYCELVDGSLPTEAQWEYAARANTDTPMYGDLNSIAWYRENSGNHLHPVARKAPNSFGLFDMLGNAPEWVLDNDYKYETDVTKNSPPTDPKHFDTDSTSHIERGGSYDSSVLEVRASSRIPISSGQDSKAKSGFRCVWGKQIDK